MNYEEALAFVHGRPRLRKAPTLKRMRQFLTELGNPQTKIQAVHVAGTNGKGSTIAFLTSLLGQEGRQEGLLRRHLLPVLTSGSRLMASQLAMKRWQI